MSVGIPFACGRTDTDTEFCFNSAAFCIRNDSFTGELCVCPEGYIRDFVGGRFPNCHLPTWFLPAFFAFASAGTIWAMALILPFAIYRLKKSMKQAAFCYCLSVFLHWLHVLCVFLQEGNLIPAIVTLLFFPPTMLYTGYLMFRIVTDPVCAALGGKHLRRRKVIQGYFMVIISALFIAQVATLAFANPDSRSDRETFNLLYAVQMFLFAFAYPATGMVIIVQVRQLIATIESLRENALQTRDPAMESSFVQLQALEKACKLVSLNLFVTIPIPIVILTIGSMPYQFLFWAFNMCGIWPTAYVVRNIFRLRVTSSDGPKSSKSSGAVDHFIK